MICSAWQLNRNRKLTGREVGVRRGVLCAFLVLALLIGPQAVLAETKVDLLERVDILRPPVAPAAQEPSLTTHDGALYMVWMEPSGRETKVMLSILSAEGWSEARIVHQGRDVFVNWADFPSVAVFEDAAIAVQWLRKTGRSGYDYQVEISLSRDNGLSWSSPVIPHDDRSFAQHGFVSMIASGAGGITIVWLDGRAYSSKPTNAVSVPDAMQFRATTLSRDGERGPDVAVDVQTCSCCQTGLSQTGDGTILAAYRDRTPDEIRDISVARLTEKGWEGPFPVHDDGWNISGCPVNGPAIAADGEAVAVAWFTGAGDVPTVNVAFSDDLGRSFDAPLRVDLGDPVGRVDLEMLDDETALVSWVEWIEGTEVIMLCRVDREAGCVARHDLATNAAGASVNFPRLARLGRQVYVAWTQPGENGDRVEMRRATLSKSE